MKVLVACEFSGVVRDCFLANGHDAMSCDLLPSDTDGPHYQGDVRAVLYEGWDLLIAHPPCTYLCHSGVSWLGKEDGRFMKLGEGAQFFKTLLEAPVPRRAIENPIMHRHAVEIVGRRQDQIIQPWMFGHMESKKTGLWLHGLPPLKPTHDVKHAMMQLPKKERERLHWLSPGEERWKLRSTTFQGIAEAMADQWGELVCQ